MLIKWFIQHPACPITPLPLLPDGREGFEIAAEIIPDLIIPDVMIPFVDGFKLCRHLRNDKNTSLIPIIMLTAKAARVFKQDCGLTPQEWRVNN